jgi:integrase/recombinase XerD
MSSELVPIPRRDLARAGMESLPAAVGRAGEAAAWRFIEFFAATIRNRNTRYAYAEAVSQFFAWCEKHRVYTLGTSEAHRHRLLYRESRMLFDFLVTGQIVPMNPAAFVRGPKHVVHRGKTPVLKADQARTLLDSIKVDSVIGLRDRALIGLMCYTFARVSAVVHMRVGDYYENGKRSWIRLREKGGKRHEVPAHHNAEAYLDAYLAAVGIRDEKKSPLFRSVDNRRKLTANPMTRTDVLRMVKRRAQGAGLPSSTCCHTFRATGITAYLENGGTIENAQAIAAHESPRTTKLYDRTGDEITLDEVERIAI